MASLKRSGWTLLLAGVVGFASGYRAHELVPSESPRQRVELVTAALTPGGGVAAPSEAEAERSGATAAAMSSGVVLGGGIAQPLPAY